MFAEIKKLDGIGPADILKSLNTDVNRDSIFKAKESAGKSGSFFFFSYDRKFLIKTMNDGELSIFRKALPTYLLHCRENRNNLIARIYGVFTVQMEDIAPVHLFLMANCAQSGKDIVNVFDLKGSMINREEKDYNAGTLKDVNLLNICSKEKILKFR